MPVDRWARPELPALREAVAQLRSRVGPGETWRLSVERRTDTLRLDPPQVIRALAELIDARVDLTHPDKVVLVQFFDDWAAISVVAPSDIFSVVKVVAGRLAPGPAPDP